MRSRGIRPRHCLLRLALVPIWASLTGPAYAGPPYVSDDPEPNDYKHWEIYLFAAASGRQGGTAADAGLDFNYGAARDLQLTAMLPLSYDRAGGTTRFGAGDVELAAKYKFVHQKKGSWVPDIAFFPRASIPTAGSGLGSGRLQILLPMWVQKDFGPWALFVGGGYQINPGVGNRDYWLSGVGLTRAVTKKLVVGAEIYHHGPDAAGASRSPASMPASATRSKAPIPSSSRSALASSTAASKAATPSTRP
jgi:hypothetical protein